MKKFSEKGEMNLYQLTVWLLYIAMSVFTIVTVFFIRLAQAEIITENRDGVIYIYNTYETTGVTKPEAPILRNYQEAPPLQTEECYLIDEANSLFQKGSFYDAATLYKCAGDYEKAMYALSKYKDLLDEESTWVSTAFQESGDWDGLVKRATELAERAVEEKDYLYAIKFYEKIWDTEKVKEMYKLQQQKARNTLR